MSIARGGGVIVIMWLKSGLKAGSPGEGARQAARDGYSRNQTPNLPKH